MLDKDVLDRANSVLKSKKDCALEPVKAHLREARKETMRTMRRYICDVCDSPILNPEDGYIVHGNIYLADPNQILGMIGNNFPEGEGVKAEHVRKTVLCKKCFNKALTCPKAKAKANTPQPPEVDCYDDF